jgi:predicted metal-binding membrane protein
MATADAARSERDELGAGLVAVRAQIGVVLVLIGAAGLAWWSTAVRMSGMNAGPGTSLGRFGWFMGVWAVMMAAMMMPSLAPTAATQAALASTHRNALSRAALFVAGYMLAWSAAGALAYALFAVGKSLLASQLSWHQGGRWLAAGVLVLAAAYELTPLKHACLARCRSPRRFLLGERGARGLGGNSHLRALLMGHRCAFPSAGHGGGCCIGCSSALMAALFALGVMSLTWMALVALLLAAQKLTPWRRAATIATALLLVVIAAGILLAPHQLPGFVVPNGGMSSVHSMKAMG